MDTVLAIDIGGTFTKIGIVDDTGKILASKVFGTKSKEPFETYLKELIPNLNQLLDALNSKIK